MKVGLVLERFDPERGGLEHWTWQFAKQLVNLGHEVHVITSEFVNPGPDVPLIWHPVEESSSPLQRAKSMESVLRGLTLDIVHDMGCGWHADIYHAHGGSTLALWEHNLMRIPRWRQFRLWRERRYREQEAIEKRQQSQLKAVFVAVSQMVQNHFETLHHIPREQIRMIYNGVDIERFSPLTCQPLRDQTRFSLGTSKNEVLFVMVAHNLRLKNAETAIRALKVVVSCGAPVRLLIVGGKKPKPFLEMTKKLGLMNLISFLDASSDVRPFYAAADVLLHPTWYDPCSLVALEALACSLPVITSGYNGVSELMTHGQEGYVLDQPSDISSLADCMKRLIEPQLRSQMGSSARKLAEKHTIHRQTSEFLELYAELANRKK